MTTLAAETATDYSKPDYSRQRRAMIDSQLRTSGVNRPDVLRAMGSVARHDFLPEGKRGHAYIDRAIPLENGALAAPAVHGKMLELADIRAGDSVLVVENGTGYLAALAEALGGKVTRTGPDLKAQGSYDVVLVDGAAEELPKAVAKKLAPEGRLVTGIAQRGVTRIATGRLAGKDIALLPVEDIGMPRIAAFDAKPGWSF